MPLGPLKKNLWRHENFDEAQALRTMWISNQASNFIDFSKYYTGDHEFQAQFLPFLRKIQGLILISFKISCRG